MRQLKIQKIITPRNVNTLDKYLHDISKEELISPEMEVELARRIKKNDKQSVEKLVRANLRFVISVAKQYQNKGLSLSDLISEGNIGLIKAAEKFDETKGFKFISYAVWWIRQSILQALSEKTRIVRLPLNKTNELNRINKAVARFEYENEREPTHEEIATLVDISSKKVKELYMASSYHRSIDAPVKEHEEYFLKDTIPNADSPQADESLLNDSLKTEVHTALNKLNSREKYIVQASFGIGMPPKSNTEIAESMDVKYERIKQIRKKALLKLRSHPEAKTLKSFL